MTGRKTTVHRSKHLRVDKFYSNVSIYIWTLCNNFSTTFPVCKKEWKSNSPPTCIKFYIQPPPPSALLSFSPMTPTLTFQLPPPPSNYFTVPIKFYEITAMKRFLLEPRKTNFKSLKFHSIRWTYTWRFHLCFLNSCQIWNLFSRAPVRNCLACLKKIVHKFARSKFLAKFLLIRRHTCT